jgi:hypothetical protein
MVDLNKLGKTVGTVYKYLGKAVQAREQFYRGQEEAREQALKEKQPNLGPEDAVYRFADSLVGQQLIADNRWHMAQAEAFASAAVASGVLQLIYEQQQTNALLKKILEK